MKIILLLFYCAKCLDFFGNLSSGNDFCQVVITEIMADPYPSVSLPDAEYIEIYNRGTGTVNLLKWQLKTGNHTTELSSVELFSGEHIIICDKNYKQLFLPFGRVMAVENMPAIVNTGQTITLISPSGSIIHSVTFSKKWYTEAAKSNGGWSLEMIDPENPCAGSDNWRESTDIKGGTPGSVNSVFKKNPDLQQPSALRAVMYTDSAIRLIFDEKMDSTSIFSTQLYSADHDFFHPANVDPVEPDYQSVILSYDRPFPEQIIYEIKVLPTLCDCVGNTILVNSPVHFGIPQIPEQKDIIFNEILFDPLQENAEFIELFNKSGKILDLSELVLGYSENSSSEITKVTSLENHPFLVFPGQYIVITSSARRLPGNCYKNFPAHIAEVDELFVFPNNGGFLTLSDTDGHMVDGFTYSTMMHDNMLVSTKGVSLERIDVNKCSDNPLNWHSASTRSGYSTPCTQNSQAINENAGQLSLNIQPQVFSPDNDGIDDFTEIEIEVTQPGVKLNITVFDMNGNSVKTLIENHLSGTTEKIIWDGSTDKQQIAAPGIYIVFVELLTNPGKFYNFKKVVTLIRRL